MQQRDPIYYAVPVLAALTGFLIALPVAASAKGGGPFFLFGGFALGLMAGIKKRNSRSFFYLCSVCVLVLAVLIVVQMRTSPLP